MTPTPPTVSVSRKGEERLRSGHLWVFGDDLREVPSGLEAGEWVRVRSRRGDLLGTGTLNLASRISLRMVSRREVFPGPSFLCDRIREAIRRREEAGMGDLPALRLLYSEGDFLPGLIADRYGSMIVLQILTAGMERAREAILSGLIDVCSPRVVCERSEGAGRRQEGLPERRGILWGEGPPAEEIELDGLRFRVYAETGPKTGFFLDQRENRRIVRELSAGRTVLDGFCSSGAFGMYALAGGAERVVAIDASEPAVEAARAHAAANGFASRWEGRAGDLFREMREMLETGRRFGLVVLDPPAFAKTREGRAGALRGYRDINRLGFSLVEEGGILATSSCTQLIDMAKWMEALREAAAEARADAVLLRRGGQPPDHPVLLGMPETEYLKFAVFRVGKP
ncbi:MAG: class I SAM-dependent rRNA methyltransferase [Deltaproteobacteria bacterium]